MAKFLNYSLSFTLLWLWLWYILSGDLNILDSADSIWTTLKVLMH